MDESMKGTGGSNSPDGRRGRGGTMLGNVIGILVASLLLLGIAWYCATTIDDRRNARLLAQYGEDAVVASL
ncbi:MAG: hypothetical protein EOP01_09245, partial [Propionibacteriaceae bacterium]